MAMPASHPEDRDVLHGTANAGNLGGFGRLAGAEIDAVERVARHQPCFVLAVAVGPDVSRLRIGAAACIPTCSRRGHWAVGWNGGTRNTHRLWAGSHAAGHLYSH